MQFRFPPTGVVLASLLLVIGAVPAAAEVLITVDKSTQTMSVNVDGYPRYFWKVSTGRAGYDTPSGYFRPLSTKRQHFSKEWDDAPMPYSIFFTAQGHAIHGSYQTRRLGSAVSHGCIRLAPANAAILFALVRSEGLVNTRVVVTGGGPVVAFRGPFAPRPGPFFAPRPLWQTAPPPAWAEDEDEPVRPGLFGRLFAPPEDDW